MSVDQNGFAFADGNGNDFNISFGGTFASVGSDGQTDLTASLANIKNVERQTNGEIAFQLSPEEAGISRAVLLDLATGASDVQIGGATFFTGPDQSNVTVDGGSTSVQFTRDGFDSSLSIGADDGVTLTQASGGNAYVFSLIGENPDGSSRYGMTEFDIGGVSWNGATDLSGSLSSAFSTTYDNSFTSGSGYSNWSLDKTQIYLQSGLTSNLPDDEEALANAALTDKWNAAAAPNYVVNRSTLTGAGTLPGTSPYYGNAFFTGIGLASAYVGNIPAPSIIDVTVVGFGVGGDSVPQNPLVLDLDGRGIELVAQSRSAARFDALADGVQRQIGWVGKTNGILVFDRNRNGVVDSSAEWFGQNFTRDGATPAEGQTGFAALATLAQTGAASFSEATSLIDAATGASYFDELQVWVDSNQDGVTGAGELFGLSDFESSFSISRQVHADTGLSRRAA